MTPPKEMTDVQEAFMRGMTDQRAANMWDAADFIAELSPEAREFLRGADKQKIERVESALRFMEVGNLVWKFIIVGGATLFGAITGILALWDYLSSHFTVRIK